MDTNKLITLLREQIQKSGYKCYSPDLPHNDEVCAAISLGEGENQRSLSQSILYSEIPFYLLIRGTKNDSDTRSIADTIFNLLDYNTSVKNKYITITLITCKTPNYAFRDENQRIHYNINCKCRVEWRNEQSTIVQ